MRDTVTTKTIIIIGHGKSRHLTSYLVSGMRQIKYALILS